MAKITFIGAHPDDIELGCGGSVHKLAKNNEVECIVLSKAKIQGNESIEQEFNNSMKELGVKGKLFDIAIRDFYNQVRGIKNIIYEYKSANIIYGPSEKSAHTDHSILGKCIKSVFQEHTIYAYEDIRGGYYSKVNYWESLTDNDIIAKFHALDCYNSQNKRPYFNNNITSSFLQMRGSQIQKNYAEAFEVVRMVK